MLLQYLLVMRCEKLGIQYNGKEKLVTVVGEYHIYGGKESKWAEEFLKNEKFDFIFAEGGINVGFVAPFYNAFFLL